MDKNSDEGKEKKKKKEEKKKKKKDEAKSSKEKPLNSGKERGKEGEKAKPSTDASKTARGAPTPAALAVPAVRCDAAAADDARRWLQATLARAGDRGVTASVLVALWARERGR